MEKDGILTEKVVLHVHDLLQVTVFHASISSAIAFLCIMLIELFLLCMFLNSKLE